VTVAMEPAVERLPALTSAMVTAPPPMPNPAIDLPLVKTTLGTALATEAVTVGWVTAPLEEAVQVTPDPTTAPVLPPVREPL